MGSGHRQPLSERVERLRAQALRSHHIVDPQAAELERESLADTVGEPEIIRQAKALAHAFQHQAVVIHDDELLVGSRPGLTFLDGPEITQRIFGRRTFAPSWPVPDDTAPYWNEGIFGPAGNHTTLDYESIFASGFRGILDRLDKRLASLPSADRQKREFLTALRSVGEGYLALSDRYAEAAEKLAESAAPERARELRTIAANCRRVPAEAPRTFWEACQCAWFSFFFLPDSPGRVDQYLYPCYQREREAGTISEAFARELLSCLWLKIFCQAGAGSGVSAHNHLTLGGVTAAGADAANPVTELCLDVTAALRLQRPQVGLRVHPGTPTPLLEQAVRVLRSGTSNPDFCNDDQIVPALTRIGVALEDARDFSLSGCHEVIVTGKAQMGSVEGFINLPKILRMVLGLEPALLPDADPAALTSPTALREALTDAMKVVAAQAHASSMARDETAAKAAGGNLAASLVVRDCIENCLGYTQGGARYNFCNWDIIGLANLTDSLVAIDTLVFAERLVDLPSLAAILARNWEGAESLRQRIAGALPHFGNDCPEVDAIARWLIESLDDSFRIHRPYRGGRYILGTLAGGENMHVEFGRVTGATPDGRRAGDSFADSIGPAQGHDRRGVTAMLNSVAGLPHHLLPTAVSLNVKLDPKLLATEQGVAAIAALIRGHFAGGGQQFQFNLVDRETLLAARREPERYRHLMVRVAGYCAPFTSLWDDLQDEIIARTSHQVES